MASASNSINCETDFLQGMVMGESESWSPSDSSPIACSVSASSLTGSIVEASSSPILRTAAETFSECSDNQELLHEPIHVNDETLMLPSDLCTNSHLLKSILTMENITNHIPADDLEKLFNDLPEFPKRNAEEKKKTLQKLLAGESFAFDTNPITAFSENLKDGHYHYDVVETAKELKGSLSYLQKMHHKKYKINLLVEGIANRNRMLQTYLSGTNEKKMIQRKQKFDVLKNMSGFKSDLIPPINRIQSRFGDILRNVNEDVGASSSSDDDSSEDECPSNYQELFKIPDLSEVDLDFVNPTLMPSQTSPNETSILTNCQIQDPEKVFHKLMYSYVKQTRKKKANVESSKTKLSEILVPRTRSRSSSPILTQAPHRHQQLLSGGHLLSAQEPEVKIETNIQSFKTEFGDEMLVSKQQEDTDITNHFCKNSTTIKTPSTPPLNDLDPLLVNSPGVPHFPNTLKLPTTSSYNASVPNPTTVHGLFASNSLHGTSLSTNTLSATNCVQNGYSYNNKSISQKNDTFCPSIPLLNSDSQCNTNSLQESNPFFDSNESHHLNSHSETHSSKKDRPLQRSTNLLLNDSVNELIHLPDLELSGNILNPWQSYPLNKFCDETPSTNNAESTSLVESSKSEKLNSQKDHVIINQSQETQTPHLRFEENMGEIKESKEEAKTSTVLESILIEEQGCREKLTNLEVNLKRPSSDDSNVTLPNPKKKRCIGFQPFPPATLSDLDGLNMMDLPIQFDENNDLVSDNDPCPPLENHCLFILIRDIICSSSYHRMTMNEIKTHLHQWAQKYVNQQGPYNTWESLLQPAVAFLAGEYPDNQPDDFVPFIEYKSNIDTYQWIGAGRDTDNNLNQLANIWKQCKNESRLSVINTPPQGDVPKGLDVEQQTPPPRCPTNWTIRPCTPEERKAFHIQEKERFDNPHKPYVYRMHGYESVVGPLRGIFSLSQSAPYGRGVRDHSMLTRDRPTFVTILALVRDAVARLPNGQGTRGDVCTLLQDSQYLCSNNKDAELNTIVSGALDRLHSEFDPCVRYDQKRKIWLYLHRNRTEQEFEKLHKESQGKKQGRNTRKQRLLKDNETQGQTKGKAAKTHVTEIPQIGNLIAPVSTIQRIPPVPIESTPKANESASRSQKTLQKTIKDNTPDLRSHIMKIKKQNKLAMQQQKLQQKCQISSSSLETSASPPIYTSCLAGVTTTACIESLQSIQAPHKLDSQSVKTIPVSSAPLKTSAQKQIASSRVVLVKTQSQNSLIQDGRKPIMILKPKGNEDGKCMPRQVYLIDDKSLSTESGLSQIIKQPIVSSQSIQKNMQTQSVSTGQSSDRGDSLDTYQEKVSVGQVPVSQFTQFAVSSTSRQGTKKINLTPTQQKQLQQLLFSKPQLVKAGNQPSLNQLKQVLLFKTGVLPKRNKSEKEGEEQTVLCHTTHSGDNQIGQMILVKQQDSNSSQLVGESVSHEQVHQLQFEMESLTNQKTLTNKKKETSSGSVTKTTPSTLSPIPSIKQGPPPPYSVSESRVTTSSIDSLVASQTSDAVSLQLQLNQLASSKEDQAKMTNAGGVISEAQNKTVGNQAATKTSQVLKLMAGSNSRVLLTNDETKSLPLSFNTSSNKPNSDNSCPGAPASSVHASPVVKHQVLGKFVSANFGTSQNQQILVQNQSGVLKNAKNQPIMAKLVTQGSSSGQLIKVLSTPQGQPIIGKISSGGNNPKPVVAKIHNAQGQPIYCMEDLFSQSNKAPTACYRLTPSQGKQSKQQKLYATVNSANQVIGLTDQLVKQNILIKPHQTLIQTSSIQSNQAVTQTMAGMPQTQVKPSSQQISTITSQGLLPTTSTLAPDKSVDANLAKSLQQTLFTTKYLQTLSSTPGSQKIQVALTQSDVEQQFQQYLQVNQIYTTVVGNSEALQTLTAGKQQAATQKINVSPHMKSGKNESLVNSETNQMKQNATVMAAGTQFVTSMSGMHRVIQQPNKFITTTNTAPQLVRMVHNGGMKSLAGNSIILTSGKSQQGDLSQPTSQSTVLLASQGLQTTNGRTLTLVQQGNGQPIFLPSNFQGGTLNIKTLQGMKVIPFNQNGRQQVVARLISPNVQATSQPIPNAPTKPNGDSMTS